jgi:hypothetical protein
MISAMGKRLTATGAAAALVVLCTFWTVSVSVAQENDTPSNVTWTVEQCLANSTDGSHESFEKTLTKQSIIDRDLLQTKLITKDMCADLLERAPSDTLVQRLIAARNYVQEIGLIEGAMRKAANETGANGKGGEGDGGAAGGGDGITGVSPTTKQAAAISGTLHTDSDTRPELARGFLFLVSDPAQSSVGAAQQQYGDDEPTPGGGADPGPSIEEQLDAGTEAGVRAGASRPEAAAGTRCSLEVRFLDDFVQELIPGSYRLTPEKAPKELQYGTTKRIRLIISPETREVFEKIRQKNAAVAEASESNIGCVSVTNVMKATLGSLGDLDISSRDESVKALYADRSTEWEWYVTGKPEGRQSLYLDLSYEVSTPHQDATFRSHEPPLLEEAILVKSTPLQDVSGFVGGDWLSFSEFIIAVVTSVLAPAGFFLFRRYRKRLSSEPADQPSAGPQDEGPA